MIEDDFYARLRDVLDSELAALERDFDDSISKLALESPDLVLVGHVVDAGHAPANDPPR